MVEHLTEESILLKNATIYDPLSQHNGSQTDLFIEKGQIQKISKNIEASNSKVIDCNGLLVMPALFDIRCSIDEPGNEHKETLETLCFSAASGGFSGIAGLPSSQPVVQNKSAIQFLSNHKVNKLVKIHPLGAATENLSGDELSELYDMKQAGAVGFSNGNNAYSKTNVLYKLLLYTSNLNVPVFSHAEDPYLAQDGQVNESKNTIHTGLKYRPAIAEYSRIQQEIEVAKYANAPLHFSHISCKESVEIIRKAKKEGHQITCDASILHLVLNDAEVLSFDSRTKLLPPLRTNEDRLALIEGLKDGTIDAISSDHHPQNIENKVLEFDYASFGAITLQSFFSLYNEYLSSDLSLDQFINLASVNPRKLLGLDPVIMEENQKAEIAIFDPAESWRLDKNSNTSKSENTPFWNKNLKGRCRALISSNNSIEF